MYLDTGPCWLLCRVGYERSRLHVAASAMVSSFRFDGMQNDLLDIDRNRRIGKWKSFHGLAREGS